MTLSFRQRLLIPILALLLVGLITLGLVANRLLSHEVQQATEGEINNTLRAAEIFVNGWVKAKGNVLRSVAQHLPKDPQRWPEALTTARDAAGYDLTYVGTSEGKMVQSLPEPPLPAGYDPRKRPWYSAAQRAGQLTVTAPYMGASPAVPLISLVSPLRNGVDGVIAGDIQLSSLTEELLTLKTRWTSQLWLLDPNGQLIAHPDAGYFQKPVSELIAATELPAQDGVIKTLHYQDRDWFVATRTYANTGWRFVLLVDKREATVAKGRLVWQLASIGLVILVVVATALLLLVGYLTRPLRRLAALMNDISTGEGDLTRRLDVERQDEFGQVSQAFNQFIARLQSTIREVIQLAARLNDDARSTADQSHLTLDEIARQQQELSQLSAAAQQMSAATGEIAGNAEATATAAQEAADSTQTGLSVVEQNREAISRLADQVNQASGVIGDVDEQVQNITGILATIQGIAEQTNLLALNAAIEAARAGEHGRGFAVVADEVRDLSSRTHRSTEEIQHMIDDLKRVTQRAVEGMTSSEAMAHESVDNAAQAAERLRQIDEFNTRIRDMAAQIASAVEEQNAVTSEMSGNTEQIREVSEALATQAESGRQRAQELSQVANALKALTDRFRV
ncbi:hypothetical protein BFW38_04065 [Terasakiispira papahanaumokuakeensis]|uniref:Chemotaxis protein n=1 Tax=Terasakiispira papahanaumokuakeensis TaxID=197479 RepID=A0A1E2V761_9GAMM|nr:methyl-accepting chemotaxis protein [Terasakiispira papahanaumokuakeensis]ODC02850.1 hypothetical protein BFW38_04065 [Terasakiispira papahanaumokuakeensis]